ncbi:MAG: J domain-containing protein [Cyanobacteria bacterium K_Offshore_surface_m2_239]|nr:J domain-containing protein [Cyanobacteria bacterium K_Offshore_surface_m2_239]
MKRTPTDESSATRRRISMELSLEKLTHIDALKREWGLRNRGDVLERLLDEIFRSEEEVVVAPSPAVEDVLAESPPDSAGSLDDSAALVLVGQGQWAMEGWGTELTPARPTSRSLGAGGKSKGIDLPGFVRRRSQQLRRSLQVEKDFDPPQASVAAWPKVSEVLLRQSEEIVTSHWLNLFSQSPNAAVVEAAMSWLAHDIWPHADLCDGRLFTWTAAVRLMREVDPRWSDAPPSLERVIVTAGVLEDPFSAETLPLRIPTLVHRFVHRFRRRQRGTSFQTLESTMTLHGALRQLQLPTDPGQRVTLTQIREAYREMALKHHPDSGGSVETMRRLNEAYQLLKELYRQHPAATD